MLLFLVLSAIVTWVGRDYKTKKSLGQDPRGISNVVANGTVPLVMAGLYRLSLRRWGQRSMLLFCLFGFIASVAAITADKFASEIGVLDGMPVSLMGGRGKERGVWGGYMGWASRFPRLLRFLWRIVLIWLGFPRDGLITGPYLAVRCGNLGRVIGRFGGFCAWILRGKGNRKQVHLESGLQPGRRNIGVVLVMALL